MTDHTIVKAECPDCGDVQLKPAQIRLTDGPRQDDGTRAPGWYSFRCPRCGDMIYKTADGAVVSLLRTGGVVVEHVPEEVWEAHPTEALTIDYAIDLHRDVEGWVGA